MLSELKKKSRRMRNRRVAVLLLLALAAAVLGVTLLHKLREGRIAGLLLRDRDRQVVMLQLVLQREREKSRETKRKLEDRRAKIIVLKNQKMELVNKLSESKEMADHLQTIQAEMEAALGEKQNQISMLSEKTEQSVATNLQVTALTELAKRKEAEVEELKQRLMKLTPKENNPTAQEEIKEDVSNANEGTQKEGNHIQGKWVNFQTNADDEGSKAGGEVSQDQQNETPTNSQDQVNASEIKEQSEVPKDDQGKTRETEIQEHNEVPKNDEGNADRADEKEEEDAREDEVQASDGKKSEKLELIDTSQDGNEKQVVPEEMKTAGEGGETKTRHGRRNKKRTRRRRRRKSSSRGWDFDLKSDGYLGKAQKDENSSENQDDGTNTIVEGGGGLKRERQIDSEGNTEAGEGKQDDTNQQIPDTRNQEEKQDGSERNESVSNATVPDDTPADEGLKTEEQTSAEGKAGVATEERPDDSNQQLPDTRNQEGAGSAEAAGGDGVNRIATEEEGKEATSTEGKSEGPENLDNDADDNSSDEKVVDTADFVQDKESGAETQRVEVVKEEDDDKTTSNIEQAEVHNDGNSHQSQISENTIDTAGESSVGEA